MDLQVSVPRQLPPFARELQYERPWKLMEDIMDFSAHTILHTFMGNEEQV